MATERTFQCFGGPHDGLIVAESMVGVPCNRNRRRSIYRFVESDSGEPRFIGCYDLDEKRGRLVYDRSIPVTPGVAS